MSGEFLPITSSVVQTRKVSSSSRGSQKKIGSFVNIFHDIAGEVFATDTDSVVLKGFTYDGEGPDTFFLAGTSKRPSAAGSLVLPWPADGKEYSYTDRDIPLIKRSFDGSEDVVLQLPAGVTVDQLKWDSYFIIFIIIHYYYYFRWISVWCRDFDINFGHVTFPKNFSYP